MHVNQGDSVKRGDLLISVDIPYIEANAPSTAVPMIFTALPDNKTIKVLKKGDVDAGLDIVEIDS